MKYCTAKSGQWPDASADVSPGEIENFLAHAKTCPYHAEIVRAEDDEFGSVFRSARGLDAAGRILRGAELQNAIADHERLEKEWETVGRVESLFGLISLYNGGRLIACCGEFLDFTDHQALHDLDPRPGLQIRARCSSDNDEEVLLGFYALSGVRHDGEERLFPLDNGYTIGLKVEQHSSRNFQIGFRCVEHGVIEREKVAGGARPKRRAKGAGAGGSLFTSFFAGGCVPGGRRTRWSRALLPQAGSLQMRAVSVSLVVVILVTCSGYIWAHRSRWVAETNATQMSPEMVEAAQDIEAPSDAGEIPGATGEMLDSFDPTATTNVGPALKTLLTKSAGSSQASLRDTTQPSKASPDNSTTASNAVLRSGLPPDIPQALATAKHEDNPPVVIKQLWGGVIRSSDQKVGAAIDVKHYGKDPALLDHVRKVIRARADLTEVLWSHGGVRDAEPSTLKVSYETAWTIIRPQEEESAGQSSLIVVELRTLSDSARYRVLYGGVFRVLGRGTDRDYEVTIGKAVDELYDHLDGWLRQPEGLVVIETVADPVSTQRQPHAAQELDTAVTCQRALDE